MIYLIIIPVRRTYSIHVNSIHIFFKDFHATKCHVIYFKKTFKQENVNETYKRVKSSYCDAHAWFYSQSPNQWFT